MKNVCPNCGAEIKLKKDKFQLIIYFIILIFIMFAVWAYKRDLAMCYEMVRNCNPLTINPLQNNPILQIK